MPYAAVLFDLDGTLLDTLEDLADAMNAVLAASGFPEHPLEAYKYFVGRGIQALVHDALPAPEREPATIDRHVQAMQAEYAQRWDRKTRPYPGIPELLDELTRRGLAMAVLSNKPDEPTQLAIAKLLPRWHFALVQGARPGIPRKPDPAAAVAIAETLAVAPADIVYLGDTGIDMETACAARMHPIGALWGFRTADELTSAGAAVLIDQPEQLLDVLDGEDADPVHRPS